MFEALLRDIDLVYTKLEGFCVKQAGPGAAPSNWDPHSLAGATLVHPTAVGDSPFIEHCRVSSVPFHLRHVQNAVWLSMRTKTKRSTTSFFRNVSVFDARHQQSADTSTCRCVWSSSRRTRVLSSAQARL